MKKTLCKPCAIALEEKGKTVKPPAGGARKSHAQSVAAVVSVSLMR